MREERDKETHLNKQAVLGLTDYTSSAEPVTVTGRMSTRRDTLLILILILILILLVSRTASQVALVHMKLSRR
jgi:hypothetical protein